VPAQVVEFVCPRCQGGLSASQTAYRCDRCDVAYPILFGIPDFRLRTDRYLTLDEEREKARKLDLYGRNASFEQLVQYYYSITFDLPPDRVRLYQKLIQAGPERARPILRDLAPRSDSDVLVDLGCGTAGLLIAAQGRYRAIYGVDIALRWLVVCQKRLRERGVTANLVCADVEALPFPAESFTQAAAADLIEHVYDIDRTFASIEHLLQPGGKLWLSATNRYCPGPHPLTGVWAIGFLPARPRAWVLGKLKGIDLLRYANLVSSGDIARRLQGRGFVVLELRPKQIDEAAAAAYTPLERILIALYRFALRRPILRRILLKIGPAFEIVCRKGEHEAWPSRTLAG
jgi:SAM-dependent methyltransferase